MWKELPDYEGIYEVHCEGRVRRIALKPVKYFMQELAQFPLPNGYLVVRLRKPGFKRLNAYVHHLVGKVFVPNPENLRELNHEDGDKEHNSADNLVWTTRSENNKHKNRVLLTHHNQTDYEVTYPNGRTVLVHNLSEFAESVGVSPSGLNAVANGNRSHHHGFKVSNVSRKD